MTQKAAILHYLKQGHSITPLDALRRFGCFRLGARILELTEAGHTIERDWHTTPDGKRVRKYWLGADS